MVTEELPPKLRSSVWRGITVLSRYCHFGSAIVVQETVTSEKEEARQQRLKPLMFFLGHRCTVETAR